MGRRGASAGGSRPRATRLAFDPELELAELRAYLGRAYDQSRLERWERQLDEEYAAIADEARFYRSSEGYLYNLTAFAMSGTKLPYLRDLTRHVPPPARLLDYGCGIGSDGLALAEAGYDVAFADFANPSTRYLRWRLERRGIEAEVYDLDRERPPGDFDLAYAFDVVEHADDPFAFLERLEQQAPLVLLNLLEAEADDTPLHRELPVRRLLGYATNRTLVHYRRYHRRSHLVLYRRDRSRGLERARSRGRRIKGRIRSARSRLTLRTCSIFLHLGR